MVATMVSPRTGDNMMSKRLTDLDARAVDLLLDRDGNGKPDSNGGGKPAVADGNGIQLRVQGVERVLAVLNHCPASEPSTDLIDRVLHRLEDREAMRAPSPAARPTPPAPGQFPHA